MVRIAGVLMLLPTLVLAQCEWSAIRESGTGDFIYSQECHIEVGKLKLSYELQKSKVAEYKKLADNRKKQIEILEDNREMWKKEAERSWKYSTVAKWVYFGAGVVTSGLAMYFAGKVKEAWD